MPNALTDNDIQHVVVLMLENRGFDHVMGWLYDQGEPVHLLSQEDDNQAFLGLSTQSQEQLQALANPSPLANTAPISPIKGTRAPNIPTYNPGEHFVHIMGQMWGVPNGTGEGQVDWGSRAAREQAIAELTQNNRATPPPMTGYAKDFAAEIQHTTGDPATSSMIREIMETYTREQLPVLSALARHYAVSDLWFCSVPSQTNTNRAFSMAGTSRGLVTNNYFDAFVETFDQLGRVLPGSAKDRLLQSLHGGSHADALPPGTTSMFNLLSDYGVPWKVYWQSPWPPLREKYQYVRMMFPELAAKKFDDQFVKFDGMDPSNPLFRDAQAGNLPAVTWIEPQWGGGPEWNSKLRAVGNDMHPVCDTTVAEDFVANLYRALTQREDGSVNPSWNRTLFIITFDENGGTYDHFPPAAASATHRDRTPQPGDFPDMDPETRTQFGFGFDQLGVRVPTLFISPLIRAGTLLRSKTRTPFDHTSLISTILEWKGVPRESWFLGERVAQAPSFDHVLELDAAAARNPTDPDVGLRYAVSVGVPRSDQAELVYGEPLLLQYIGTKWEATPRSLGT